MKKTLSLLIATGLILFIGANAISYVILSKNNPGIAINPSNKQDLNKFDKKLGAISENNFEVILSAFNSVNNLNLTSDDVEIINITDTSALIKAKLDSKSVKGEITVSFVVKPNLTNLKNELGALNNNDFDNILSAFNFINDSLGLTSYDVEIINITDTSALIKAKLDSQKITGQINVTFSVKKNLNDSNTQLGALDKNDFETIMSVFNRINNLNLTSDDVEIINITDTSALIKAKPNSQKITGQINVTFTVKENLSNLDSQIGSLNNNNFETILAAFNLTNNLEFTSYDVDIEEISDTSALIKAKPDSEKAIGQINVTFSIKKNLNDSNTQLGAINNNDFDNILAAFNSANNNLGLTSDDVEIIDITDTSALIKAKPDSQKAIGQINVTFSVKKNLNDSNIQLGALNDNTFDEIISVFNSINNNLNLASDDVEIINITDTSALVKAKPDSKLVSGEVNVIFSIKQNLNNSNTQLGAINNNDFDNILAAFNSANNNLGLTSDDVEIINITDTSALIKAKPDSQQAIGQIDVTFTIKQNLSNSNTQLGALDINDFNNILAAFNSANNNLGLTSDDVEIINITDTSALIKAKPDSQKTTGQISITFTTKKNLSNLDNQLGALNENDSKTILLSFNEVNSLNLTSDDVEIINITDTSALIKAKPDSQQAIGQIDVTFTIKQNLSNSNTQLGALDINDFNNILAAFNSTNNNLGLTSDDVDITNITQTSALIKAKPDSQNVTGQINVNFTTKKELSNFEKQLKAIDDNSFNAILAAFNSVNNNLGLTSDDVDITNITQTSAWIKAKLNSQKVIGQVTVLFSIKQNLEGLNKQLGALNDNTFNTILAAFNSANNNLGLTSDDVDITNITQTSALIKAKPDSQKVNGQIDISFTTKQNLSNLSNQLQNLDDNTFNTILLTFNSVNGLNLTSDDVDITNITQTSALIKAKLDSQKVVGELTVSFNIKIKIEYTISKNNPRVGEQFEITITNWDLLTNPVVTFDSKSITQISVNRGKYTFVANTPGTTQITIHADNYGGIQKQFEINIPQLVSINAVADGDSILNISTKIKINILNLSDLVSFDATLDSSGLTLARLDKSNIANGELVVSALSIPLIKSEIVVKLMAKNAVEKKVIITIGGILKI